VGLAKGGTRVDHYVFSYREGVGIYENGQVVVCGKGTFACCNGIAFPSDGKLPRDFGDEMVIEGIAPKDEVASGDIGFGDFVGFLDGKFAAKEFSPAFLKVSDFESYPFVDELVTGRAIRSDYEKTGEEGIVDGALQTVSLAEDVGR